MTPPAHRLQRYDDYLALEQSTRLKHEFLDGRIVAMSGGTRAHAELQGNLFGMLFEALSGKPCRPYPADMRVRVPATGLATYPDLSVVCGPFEAHPEDDDALANPTLIAEVLSPSTEGWDRGGKFQHYRKLASLQTYLLLSQHAVRIEVFRRTEGEQWILEELGAGQTLRLPSLDTALSVDALYADVALEEGSPLRA